MCSSALIIYHAENGLSIGILKFPFGFFAGFYADSLLHKVRIERGDEPMRSVIIPSSVTAEKKRRALSALSFGFASAPRRFCDRASRRGGGL